MSYNYNPKVEHPDATLPQMVSEGFKPPFYFGGSQIPIAINGSMLGSGFRTPYRSAVVEKRKISSKGEGLGLGLKTTTSKHGSIRLPHTYFNK